MVGAGDSDTFIVYHKSRRNWAKKRILCDIFCTKRNITVKWQKTLDFSAQKRSYI